MPSTRKPTKKKTPGPTRRSPARVDRRKPQPASPDFKIVFDGCVQGIIVHRNFKPIYVNDSFAKIFGYKNGAEVMAMPILRPLVPDDMWQRLESDYDEMMRGDKDSVIARIRGIHKTGREIWVSITARAIDWPGDRRDSKAMILTALDVTKQAEMEYGLLQNEQRLRSVLEILPYPIYVARRDDGHILFVNRKSCLLFQQSAGQLLRSRSYDFLVDSSDRENILGLLDKLSDVRDIEVKMRTAQGRIFIAELAAIKLVYEGAPAVLIALNDISQRKEMEAELFRQASTDALTGINNRRYFQNLADQEMRRTRRFSREMSLMMIDIDHFKPVNDSYGHATGDGVLQGVVKRSLESLRQSDTMGRLGGEEFAVLLPETGITAAFEVADRLRQHIQERPIVAEKNAIPCTVSIGIAQLSPLDGSVDDVISRADEALYKAKNGGRNRVEIAPPPSDYRIAEAAEGATGRRKPQG